MKAAGTVKLSESQQQAQCVQWFRLQYPHYARLLFAVPNGGLRSKKTAAILRKEGTLAGIPDLVLCIPNGKYHGLFIEQKRPGNKPSAAQLQAMEALSQQGYLCRVVYSVDEFITTIKQYLK